MGSSVDIFCAFCLWNAFCEKVNALTTSSGNCGFPGDIFPIYSRLFTLLLRQIDSLLQVQISENKTVSHWDRPYIPHGQ